MSKLSRAQIRVAGRVQGVGYRSFAQRTARALGLVGYALNLPDGNVEVDVEGERVEINRFIERLRQGPPAAAVTNVDVTWGPYLGQYPGFTVRFSFFFLLFSLFFI